MAVTVYDVVISADSDYGWMLESAYPATLTFKPFVNGTSLGRDFNVSITATGDTIQNQLYTVSGLWCCNEAACLCSLNLGQGFVRRAQVAETQVPVTLPGMLVHVLISGIICSVPCRHWALIKRMWAFSAWLVPTESPTKLALTQTSEW